MSIQKAGQKAGQRAGYKIKKPGTTILKMSDSGLYKKIRRRPTLPHSLPCSTIGAKELNFRVRDGNGCNLFAITTEKSIWCCVLRVRFYLIKVKS